MEIPNENVFPEEGENLPRMHDVSNVTELRKLLSTGANIDETNNFDETPLLSALRREVDYQLIKEFLIQGADVNAKDCWGVTPLYCAVARHGNDLNVIKLLLENGADIQSGKRDNDRFLDHTVTHNGTCAKLLIKYKFLKNVHLVNNLSPVTRDYYFDYKSIVDLDLKRSCYTYLGRYLDDCASEVLRMKSVFLYGTLSLIDFVVSKSPLEAFTNLETVQQITNQIYEEFANSNYYIYKDLIIDRIGRKNLLEGLNTQICSTYTSTHSDRGSMFLNVDVMYYVAKYLSETDLFNMILAFYM